MSYAAYEYALCASLLVLAMFGMGTALTVREFAAVARSPRGVVAVLLIQTIVAPLLALALARLLFVSQGVALGMVIVAALPGGSFSNMFAYLGRGNLALSISATAVSTTACLFTTAIVLQVFGGAHLPPGFRMPVGRIVFEIAVCMLVPLAAGMIVRRLAPARHRVLGTICIRASLILLGVIVVGALTSGRLHWSDHPWRATAAVAIFAFLSTWLGYAGGYLSRLPLTDSYTMAIEVLVRNGNLGLLLKATLFPASSASEPIADGVLFVILLYAGLSLVFAIAETYFRRSGKGLIYGPNGLGSRGKKQPTLDAE